MSSWVAEVMQYHDELTIEESACRVRRCTRVIAGALAKGELIGRRKGTRVYISRRELDAWAASKGISVDTQETMADVLKLVRELVAEAGQQQPAREDAV